MVRISSTLLPTNADGVPQQEIVNTSLNVSDSTAQSSLSSIDTALSSTLTVSDTTAQSSLSSIDSSLSGTIATSNSVLDACVSSNEMAVSGNFYPATQPVSIASTVSVSQSATINGSRSNLENSAAVTSGGNSTAVDVSSYTKHTVYLESTTSNNVDVLISPDGTNYYYYNSIYPMQKSGASGNYFGILNINDVVVDSIKLEYTGSANVTAGVVSRA